MLHALARPAQCGRILEIRDNIEARITEAEREGRLGEVEGLQISLAGTNDKPAQIYRRCASIDLACPLWSTAHEPGSGGVYSGHRSSATRAATP